MEMLLVALLLGLFSSAVIAMFILAVKRYSSVFIRFALILFLLCFGFYPLAGLLGDVTPLEKPSTHIALILAWAAPCLFTTYRLVKKPGTDIRKENNP